MPDGLRSERSDAGLLQALARIWGELPAGPASLRELLSLFARELNPRLPGLHSSFAVPDEHREHLVLTVSGHAAGPDPDLDGATLVRLAPPEREALEAGRPWLLSPPGPLVPETARRLQARGIATIVVLPLLVEGRLEAAWMLGAGRGGPAAEQIERLGHAAAALGATLARADRREAAEQRHVDRLAETGRVVANVAHELGSPLQSVISLAQLLQRDPGRNDRLEAASRILRSALRCRSLVQDLLDHARKQPLRRDRVRVEDAVMEALELDAFSSVGDVQVSVSEDAPLPPVRGDLRRLTQVFTNLIHNARLAVGAAPEREPVRVLLDVIGREASRIELPRGRTAVRVAVEDRGCGVPRELRDRIFEPFVSTRVEGEGTGLGLSICRDVVADHGGLLYLDTAHTPGARFVVELPAAEEAEAPPPSAAAPPGSGPYRILLIDDDQDVLQTYEVILAHEDHRVRSCSRAREALELLDQDPYDVIICDLRLPDLRGPEFFERLRARHPELARRVVFASGDVANEESRRFLSEVPNPVLLKPFLLDDLLQAIHRAAE